MWCKSSSLPVIPHVGQRVRETAERSLAVCAKMQGIYFDKQDRDILALVNRILESDGKQSDTFLLPSHAPL